MDKEKMNTVTLTGVISSMSELKTKSNGKNYLYINIVQNDRNGKASYYPLYLDGATLENFYKDRYQIGDRVHVLGKLDSYQKDSKTTVHVRPFEFIKVEKEKTKDMEI